MTTQYKPLGLAQVCEIRDIIDKPANQNAPTINLIVESYQAAGFDPADVRQAAEEALRNLRKS